MKKIGRYIKNAENVSRELQKAFMSERITKGGLNEEKLALDDEVVGVSG